MVLLWITNGTGVTKSVLMVMEIAPVALKWKSLVKFIFTQKFAKYMLEMKLPQHDSRRQWSS